MNVYMLYLHVFTGTCICANIVHSPYYPLDTASVTEPGASHAANKPHSSSCFNLPQYSGHRHLHAHTVPVSHGYWDPHGCVLDTLAH